ncbi:uncharacterized protein L201_002297 [Kwoniella dendrophila CBS 6074]|uniref:F-box domain-containing protein n=1 Tax=Kwoniella dendrophila CBS 6074 TaxID=1295534 RepID=A0AAX4JR88_9TREE
MLVESGHYHNPSRITITDLPREVIRLIALKIYDPLELTQQDRLTWGIFSTVDMHQERQDDLASLISLGMTCRKIRREVRRIQFTCIRIPGVEWAEEVIRNSDGWPRYVKSIIIDLSMFDSDPDASTRTRLSPIDPIQSNNTPPLPHTELSNLKPRTCWAESSLLTSLFNSLPNLNHCSFFADASDDSTLALLFSSLIPHPSLHAIPPTVISNSPSALSTISGSGSLSGNNNYRYQPLTTWVPLTHRLKSFGWRQRAAPPNNFRQFSQSSTFVSTLHLIRHSHNLSFLVLDADLDEMTISDILSPLKELSLRRPPIGEKNQLITLLLCGPLKNWEDQDNNFLESLVHTYDGIKELFIDRPLKKSTEVRETNFDDFAKILEPLSALPYLRLLQVGSYTFTTALQSEIVQHLSRIIPSLLVVGLLGEEGETVWWGIWRRATMRGLKYSNEGEYDEYLDTRIKFLGDGDLRILENENEDWIRQSRPPTPPLTSELHNSQMLLHHDQHEDIRMTPRNTQSPLINPKEAERIHALGLSLDGNTSFDSREDVNRFKSNEDQDERKGVMEGRGRRIMSLDRLLD